ncbi:Iwr1p [Sugiyamaella lignohabitans]|uniref:Iwr1p n=1 Tax=Sugiyamaella lignohabitans TaxID=796027 RepID=A0A167EPR4_9ASCO|nr:Iwr1p [Sugiyamaella lignohabitans]ANB14319.1 Iwr1p [Sugiyamaella lignohabitans]
MWVLGGFCVLRGGLCSNCDAVFKLAGTFENEPAAPSDVVLHQESSTKVEELADKRVFRFPKRSKINGNDSQGVVPHDDPEVSQSLTDMVQSYLGLDENKPSSPLKDLGSSGATLDSTLIPGEDQNDGDEYVYDIYYRERYTGDDSLDESKVGIIVLLDSDYEDLAGDDDVDSNVGGTDDEDSNAEDFYKNDYPDEVSGDEEEEEEEEEEKDDSDEEGNSTAVDRLAPRTKFQLRRMMGQGRGEDTAEWDGEYEDGGDEDDGTWNDDDEGNINNKRDNYDGEIEDDDDQDYDDYDDIHSPPNEVGDEQWSEDEDLEQYRDRILGNLETSLRE